MKAEAVAVMCLALIGFGALALIVAYDKGKSAGMREFHYLYGGAR